VGEVLEGKSDRNIDMAYVIRRAEEPSPFHSLLRLFLGTSVVAENAVAALSRPGIQRALQSGVIEDFGDSVRAVVCLRPWPEFFLLSDFLPPQGEPLPSDFVMSGTSASSRLLTRLTIRRRVSKALDLGTGAGTHALLAASHADNVIAIDTSKQALNLAAMNARLNGIDNVSFAEGSFFEPVAGEKSYAPAVGTPMHSMRCSKRVRGRHSLCFNAFFAFSPSFRLTSSRTLRTTSVSKETKGEFMKTRKSRVPSTPALTQSGLLAVLLQRRHH
jgi:hypothetical protein